MREFAPSLRVLAKGQFGREPLAIEPLLDHYDGIEIAAAAAAVARAGNGRTRGTPRDGRALPPSASRARERRPAMIAPVHHVGSRDNVRPADLAAAIANQGGAPGAEVGKVDVRESHSLVEVAAAVAEHGDRARDRNEQFVGAARSCVATKSAAPRGGGAAERGGSLRRGGRRATKAAAARARAAVIAWQRTAIRGRSPSAAGRGARTAHGPAEGIASDLGRLLLERAAGWIEVICGVMFSGKSEELIRRVRRAIIATKEACRCSSRTSTSDTPGSAGLEPRRADGGRGADRHARGDLAAGAPGHAVVPRSTKRNSSTRRSWTWRRRSPTAVPVIVAGSDKTSAAGRSGRCRSRSRSPKRRQVPAICVICGDPANRNQRLIAARPAR